MILDTRPCPLCAAPTFKQWVWRDFDGIPYETRVVTCTACAEEVSGALNALDEVLAARADGRHGDRFDQIFVDRMSDRSKGKPVSGPRPGCLGPPADDED